MSNLSSLKTASSAKSFPILTGSANISAFTKALNDRIASNYGDVGQHILNKTQTNLTHPGPCPHYNDPRLHPVTLQPIVPRSRLYRQKNQTPEEAADPNFDPQTLELTDTAKASLAHDITAWRKTNDNYTRDIKEQRSLDDDLYNFILEHISSDALETLNANALIPAFRALPPTCITRSSAYINIIYQQFAHGNSTVSITELTKFLNLAQGPASSDPTAAFFNRLGEHYQRVLPLLDHAKTLDQLKEMLLSMVAVKGVNKSHPPNLRALEIHLQTYPGNTALDHYAELRTAILAAQDSDIFSALAPDPISEQSSAFAAIVPPTVSPPPPVKGPPVPTVVKGLKTPGRTDECAYCLFHFGKYFYHKETSCNLKKQNITATSRRNTPRHNIASNPTTNARLTPAQLTSFLASQGLEWYTPPEEQSVAEA